MRNSPKSSRITFIILRYMRRPVIVLITVYAASMLGWVLIPGQDAQGNPAHMSFFHAFYFLAYTVTTTGFGELPQTYTEAQRMWGIVSLYAGVIAWFYALGSIVRLVQNQEFQRSLAERRFVKEVSRLSEPFCIVCGFGNTGALLTRGLSDSGMTVVVVERNPERVQTLFLRDYRAQVTGLCADARIPEHLIEAGLLNPHCKAVVALTQQEEVNLKIAVTASLLNKDVLVMVQSTSEDFEEILATLGNNVHIIDPFQTYAKYLAAIIENPAIHSLNQWLAGTPGATLDQRTCPPKGKWILCGFGRMGQWIRKSLQSQGVATVVIESGPLAQDTQVDGLIPGRASQENLLKADIEHTSGIVAGTDSDSENLSILLNTRALNPDIFTLVRQNRYRNLEVFQAARADFIMVPSLVSARRILFLLVAPLLKTFFETLHGPTFLARDGGLNAAVDILSRTVGGTQPRLWTLDTTAPGALPRVMRDGKAIVLGDVLRDPEDRNRRLACLPLVMESGQEPVVMPALTTALRPGDRVLFCGTPHAVRLLEATLNNEYTLRYLITGVDEPRGYVMRWLTRKFAAQGTPA